ncbi:hypothetical protein JCM10207_005595 [Rhodosporidiobolus poonsookiae]
MSAPLNPSSAPKPDLRTRLTALFHSFSSRARNLAFAIHTSSDPHIPPPPTLPSPAEVQEHGTELCFRQAGPRDRGVWIITWEGVEMVVKGGEDVDAHEAEATELARRLTGLPVPRVYGVRQDGNATYLYFEKLPGESLYHAFPGLSEPPAALKTEIKRAVETMHRVRPSRRFMHRRRQQIGGFPQGNLAALTVSPEIETPLWTTKELHRWLRDRFLKHLPASEEVYNTQVAPALRKLRRAPLVFVHGDFNPGNILVHEGKLSGVIDWERAGWYPSWVEQVAVVRHCAPSDKPSDSAVLEVVVGTQEEVRKRYGWMEVADEGWIGYKVNPPPSEALLKQYCD